VWGDEIQWRLSENDEIEREKPCEKTRGKGRPSSWGLERKHFMGWFVNAG
jgi:hypothetical protein